MAEGKAAPVVFKVSSGTASQAGVSRRPQDCVQVVEKDTQEKRHTPHGLPVSNEKYELLKSKARYVVPEKTSIAQRDPSVAISED